MSVPLLFLPTPSLFLFLSTLSSSLKYTEYPKIDTNKNNTQYTDTNNRDPAVTNATTTALGGLDSAQQGIDTILQALFQGQTAPADSRNQVGLGLQTAQDSLNSINS